MAATTRPSGRTSRDALRSRVGGGARRAASGSNTIPASSTAAGTGPAVGVVAVIERAGELLVIRRAAGIALGGAWCFPGGHVHPGESEPDAVVREVREEVGLIVEPVRRIWTWRRPDGGLELYWWRATLLGGELSPLAAEVEAAAWLSPQQIRDLPGILPGNLEFLDLGL